MGFSGNFQVWLYSIASFLSFSSLSKVFLPFSSYLYPCLLFLSSRCVQIPDPVSGKTTNVWWVHSSFMPNTQIPLLVSMMISGTRLVLLMAGKQLESIWFHQIPVIFRYLPKGRVRGIWDISELYLSYNCVWSVYSFLSINFSFLIFIFCLKFFLIIYLFFIDHVANLWIRKLGNVFNIGNVWSF